MVGKSCTAQKRANRFFPRACGPKSLCSEAGMREGSLSFTTCWTTAYSVSSGAPSVTARYPQDGLRQNRARPPTTSARSKARLPTPESGPDGCRQGCSTRPMKRNGSGTNKHQRENVDEQLRPLAQSPTHRNDHDRSDKGKDRRGNAQNDNGTGTPLAIEVEQGKSRHEGKNGPGDLLRKRRCATAKGNDAGAVEQGLSAGAGQAAYRHKPDTIGHGPPPFVLPYNARQVGRSTTRTLM